jgi:precorrin-6Y C5,15-methyltransferase (decarboxylating)
VVPGEAPQCLTDLPDPDAVFVGGGAGEPEMIETCWQRLPPGGCLVANVVTVEGERRLLAWQAAHGGELARIEVARLDALGRYRVWRPALAVTQLASRKP